jgi:hypothetical protein
VAARAGGAPKTEDESCRQALWLLWPTHRPFDPILDRLSACFLVICQTNCPARIWGLCDEFAPAATRRLYALRIGGGNDFTQIVIIQQNLRLTVAGFTGRTNRLKDESVELQVVFWLWTGAFFSYSGGNQRAGCRRRRNIVVGVVPREDDYIWNGLCRVGMPNGAPRRNDLLA